MLEAFHDGVERHIQRQRDGGGSERVGDVMATGQRQLHLGIAHRRAQQEVRAVHALIENVGTHVGLVVQREAQLTTRAGQPREEAGKCLVRIDDRHAIDRQCLIQRALGLGHAFHAAHALKMRGRNGVDEADIGPCDGGEIGDVARLARAHFQHGILCVLRHRQQGERQAQLVVVVAGVDVRTAMA